MAKIPITESVDIDLEREMWCCRRCGAEIQPARESYLNGCLVYERPVNEIYGPSIPTKQDTATISYAPKADFMRVIEFYCPSCGALMMVQYLPPGHPPVIDIELDIDQLKEKAKKQPK
jgi:acetone carboxylase gamma subunit